jgi:hypothetical protein
MNEIMFIHACHPVAENVFPQLDIVMVLSHISARKEMRPLRGKDA